MSLFHRVVDLHNFEVVMQCLSPQEAGCLLARVGWLKIYNPMKVRPYLVYRPKAPQ